MMRKKAGVLTVLALCMLLAAGCQKHAENGTDQKEKSKVTEEKPRVIVNNDSQVTENTKEPEKKNILVAIDPGHQGPDVDMSALEPNAPGSSEMKAKASSGTTGQYSGIPEYQLALDISLMLKTELESRGYDVLLTRENNETAISNSERAKLANESGADICVRIHANGSEDSGANGALALVPSEENPYVGNLGGESRRLADSVLGRYCAATGMADQGVQSNDTMTGINWSKIPVMILEMGFMSNKQDDLNMADEAYRAKMVTGIADGIDSYYGTTQQSSVLEDLNAQIQSVVGPGTSSGEAWQVYAKRLSDGAYSLTGEGQMKSASLIKLYTAVCVYENMELVKSQEASDGETDKLLSRMISASDNDAANTLVRRLGKGDAKAGMSLVNTYCSANGYADTHMGRLMLDFNAKDDNYTSAKDCAALLEKIYRGEVAGAKEIAQAMKQQERREKIPAGISGDTVVANKTGELDNVENDAAIVYADGEPYILCVMSQNLAGAGAARKKIVQIAGIVDNYMNP